MKIKYLVVLFVLITMLAGCGKGRSVNTISENTDSKKEVTTVDDFQKIYKDWTDRLLTVAEGTNQVYNSWSSGQISRDEFAVKTRELYKETKKLKTEISYNTVFNLSESDQKLVYYDLVSDSYYKALIQMNDFLYLLPTLEEEQVKDSYEYTSEIVNDETSKINKHLKI
jgi:hypothetical protein